MYELWQPAFDWSDYQPSPNLVAAVAHGIVLGIRKANQGTRVGGQARYAVDCENARRAGFHFGAYCFTEAAQNRAPEAEAEAFLRSTNGYADCTVAPLLDFEDAVPGAINRTLGPNGSADYIIRWCRTIKAETSWQAVVYIGLPISVAPVAELLEHLTHTPNYGSQHDYETVSGIDQRPGWFIPPDPPWTVPVQALIQPYGDNGRLPVDVMPAGTHVDLDFVNPALLDHITTQGADDMSAADVAAINGHSDEILAAVGGRLDNIEQYIGLSGRDPKTQGLRDAITQAGWSSRPYAFQLAHVGIDGQPIVQDGVTQMVPDVFKVSEFPTGAFHADGSPVMSWGRMHIATRAPAGDSPRFLDLLKRLGMNPYVVPITDPADIAELTALPVLTAA